MGNEQQPQTPDSTVAHEPEGTAEKKKEKKPIYKRVWFWVVIVVVVLVIAASGSDGSDAGDSSDAEDTSVEATEEDTGEESGEGEEAEEEEESGFEEIVLYDEDDITVSATARGVDWGDAYYTIEIVNDSDEDITVSIEDVSVDGVMADTWFYETVSAGKKANEDLDIYDIDSEEELVNVEGSLSIINADTYDDIADITFTIS